MAETVTVRFLVPAELNHPQGEHFHFADFALDTSIADIYDHVQRRVLTTANSHQQLKLLVEPYVNGPMVTLKRGSSTPLGNLSVCAGGLCSIEIHFVHNEPPSQVVRSAKQAHVEVNPQLSTTEFARAARGVSLGHGGAAAVQKYVSHYEPTGLTSPGVDERRVSRRPRDEDSTAVVPIEEPVPDLPEAAGKLTIVEQHDQDITVSRSLNAALGREIDSLGAKMNYYLNALAAMEERKETLKAQLAGVNKAIRQSKDDCATCVQNCDRLHQARNKCDQQLKRSEHNVSVTVKKLQTEQRKFSKFHDEVEKVRDAMSASEARLAIKTQKLEQLQSRNADFHRDLMTLKSEIDRYTIGERKQQKVISQLETRMKKFMASNAHLLNRVKEIESIQVPGERR